MSNVLLDFQQAKIKHLQFKSNLRSLLYGATNIDEHPVLSHQECTVGKWIYDYALKQYGEIPEMTKLEKVHEDIHTKAKQLVSLYKEGKVAEARTGLQGIEEIAKKLVGLLSILESKIDPEKKEITEAPDYQTPDTTIKELKSLADTNEELDKIINKQSIELTHQREMMKDLFKQFPAMIVTLKGANHIIDLVNQPWLDMMGKPDVKNKTVQQAFPEMQKQGFIELLNNVYKTGEVFSKKEVLVKVNQNDVLKEYYLDISIIPVRTSAGKIEGLICFSYDVTDMVNSRKIIEQKAEELKQINEDLEIKVAFRNIQLEKEVMELKKKLKAKN